MIRVGLIAGIVMGVLVAGVRADIIVLDAVQTGGFYPDAADNSPGFQNYFVGYGTTPGFPRTSERRSFFWFDLSGIGGTINSATLHLQLPFGGLIYGKGPGDPLAGPVPSDTTESFQLSATPFPGAMVTSGGLTVSEIGTIFGSFVGPPIAPPVDFPLVPPPSSDPADILIPLSALGLTFLNLHTGGDVVLTGWMPSWSFDTRPKPPATSPPPYFEADELIFGLTDIDGDILVEPRLTIDFTPVPEPTSAALFVIGLFLSRRLKKSG